MKRILIIDDDAALRTILNIALCTEGHEVIEADNGITGHQLAKTQLPDLILCDMVMPGQNGRKVVEQLRQDPLTAERQIVLMTGNEAAADFRGSMEFGADDYLKKPFRIDELLRCANARFRRAEMHTKLENKVIDDLRLSLQSTLPHEFFTPLAGIIGHTEMLRESLADTPREQLEGMLDSIERSGRRLHRTLKNYLEVVELHGITRTPAKRLGQTSAQSAREIVEKAAQTAAGRHHRTADLEIKNLDLDLPVAPRDLATVIEELVDNACAFSHAGTPITIEGFPKDGPVGLRVSDQGRGLTREQIISIGAFRQFERRKYEQQGLGLGLALVKLMIESYGGRLEIESQPGAGTRFSLVLRQTSSG